MHWVIEALEKAYAYVWEDSPKNADKIIGEIWDVVWKLPKYPEKYPPDKYKRNANGNYRVFEMYRYRVTYCVMPDHILIMRVRHTSRMPVRY